MNFSKYFGVLCMKKKKRNAVLSVRLVTLLLLLSLFFTGCTARNKTDTDTSAVTASPPLTQQTTEGSSAVQVTTSAVTTEKVTTAQTTEVQTTPPPRYDKEIIYEGAIKDYMLPLEDFSWERLYDPEFVMIHFTSAVVVKRDDPYNINHIRDIFINGEVSIHYIIERDGSVRCYIPENRVAWHAGKGEFANDEKYTNKMNLYSIGIELVGMGSKQDMSGYMSGKAYDALDDSLKCFTEEQYAALKPLVEYLCAEYDIPMDRAHIIGHEEYSPRKSDPGDLFDWSRIVDTEK